jgi:hypothetical protein
MPSEASDALKSVVLSAAPTLTAAGFSKRRNAFNRTTEPGVVQVLSFTLEKAAGGRAAATSSGRRFNVNLGVYLQDGQASAPTWVNDADCQVRQTAADLVPDGPDAHLALDDVDLASWATFHVLSMYALPWLDERRSREQVRQG